MTYSDYRKAGTLELPFSAAGSLEETGAASPQIRSWTVESYELNPADIEIRLKPPASIVEP